MKHWILLIFTLVCFSQCDKLPRNGKLDGQWQLVRQAGVDVRSRRIYWRFQLDLLEFYSLQNHVQTSIPHNTVVARFRHHGGKLDVTQVYLVQRAIGKDTLVTPEMNLSFSPIGLREVPISYEVAALTDELMKLVAATDTLVFRKF